MAVTLTDAELAVAIRVATDPDEVPDAAGRLVAFLAPGAKAQVIDYAPAAPNAVHNNAAIRLLGWLYDADPTDSRVSRALEVSGAANLLGRWKVRRALALEPSADIVPSGELPPVPPEGTFILAVTDGSQPAWFPFPIPGAVSENPGDGLAVRAAKNGEVGWLALPPL